MTFLINTTAQTALSHLIRRQPQPTAPTPTLTRSRTAVALASAAAAWAEAVEDLRARHRGHATEVAAFIDAARTLDADLSHSLNTARQNASRPDASRLNAGWQEATR